MVTVTVALEVHSSHVVALTVAVVVKFLVWVAVTVTFEGDGHAGHC